MKEPYPSNWKKATVIKRLKAHVIVDPFIASANHGFVQSFDLKEEADQWLAAKMAENPEGYDGCYVTPREQAIR
jgi:hypothetical protein